MIRPVLRVISGSPRTGGDRTDAAAADAALVAGVARGDPGAVRALTQRCLPRVHAIATRLLNDRSEAEDVAQDTFLKVWRNIGRYDPERARLETWVSRIAVNASYDRLRKRREAQMPEAAPERADGAPDAEDQLTGLDAAARVRQAVSALPERQRLALELCHFQELSNIEAAAIMEVSVEAMESLLARGRRTLRKALAEDRADLLADTERLHGQGEEGS